VAPLGKYLKNQRVAPDFSVPPHARWRREKVEIPDKSPHSLLRETRKYSGPSGGSIRFTSNKILRKRSESRRETTKATNQDGLTTEWDAYFFFAFGGRSLL
jgi:hypothetical protein